MPRMIALVAFIALSASAALPALSQDEVMILNTKELGAHQRPLVRFTHGKHSEIIECMGCHHEYDEYLNNTGGDGGNCSDCHSAQADADNPVSLIMAFHKQCKGCHDRLFAKGSPTGPNMCGQCHINKKGPNK